MKIIGIACSGRVGSVSTKLVQEVLRGATEAGAETVYLNIGKGNLMGCIACDRCKTPEHFCALKDVLVPYWDNLADCDAVILGAAMYMDYPQGEAFMFMNRHVSVFTGNQTGLKYPVGKKFLPIFAQGAPDNPKYHENYEYLTKWFDDWGFDRLPPLVSQSQLKDETLAEAFRIGQALGRGEEVSL